MILKKYTPSDESGVLVLRMKITKRNDKSYELLNNCIGNAYLFNSTKQHGIFRGQVYVIKNENVF